MPRDKDNPRPIQSLLRKAVAPPAPAAPPPPPPPSKVQQAVTLCTRCWSPSVRDYGYGQLRVDLERLGLSNAELKDVRDILPTHSTGTTGERVRAVDAVIARMEAS